MSQYDLVNNLYVDEINNIDLNYELNSDDVVEFLDYNSNLELLINE